MLKQALANMETEGFHYVSEAGIFWYIVKHLLNSTLSNIRSVLLGQEMSGSASLRPTSLVPQNKSDVGLSLNQQVFNILESL